LIGTVLEINQLKVIKYTSTERSPYQPEHECSDHQ